jgi:membrane associated rhomboid family serine protease
MIGSFIERVLGTPKTILLYFVSGIVGALFSCFVGSNVPSVGASICIYGLVGSYVNINL